MPVPIRRRGRTLVELDSEHQLQVGLLQALEEAIGENEIEAAGRILSQMVGLAQAHFHAEELLMLLHKYPQCDEHVAAHAGLLRELKEVERQWKEGRLTPTLELADRLKRSLADHLLGPDHEFARYLQEVGI